MNHLTALLGRAATTSRRWSVRLAAALLVTAGLASPAMAQVMTFTSASPATFSAAGQTITFNLTFNQSNAVVTSLNVINMNYAPSTGLSCPGLPIQPNGSVNCSFTYVTKAADVGNPIQEFGQFSGGTQSGQTFSGNISNQQQVPFVAPVLPSASISVTPASVLEDGAPNLVYTITLSSAAASAITVNLTRTGTATSGTDYTGGVATLLFPAGTTTGTVTINPTADTTIEPNETVIMRVAAGTGYTVGTPATVTGTITDDDTPSVSIAVAPASIAEDAAGTLAYTITLNKASAAATTVNLTTSGTATTGVDYTGATNALVIPAGVLTGVVTIDPTADTTIEPNETVIMTVAAGTGYTVGAPASATGTITNDDLPTATIAVAPASVTENGAPNLIYTVTLSQAVLTSTSVAFTVSGTATSGTDYAAVTSPVVIAAGATTGTITINPTGDTTIEADETVIVTLAAGAGYTVGAPATATGTILNDDVPTVSIAVAPASVAEDGAPNLIYTVTLNQAVLTPTSVNFAVTGTATSGTDFAAVTSPLVIAAGATTGTITINPTTDTTVEANETVILTLAAGTGYTVGAPAAATGTILNDDVPTVSIAVAPASVAEDGAPNLIYTVTLSQAALTATSVGFTVSGTATSGSDFAAVTSPLVIAAGATTGTITVNPTGDTTIEADETVILTLAAGAGYSVGAPAAATGTILNDDVPTLSINDVTLAEGNAGTSNATFTVSLSAPAGAGGVGFTIATANGTATAGVDYVAKSLTAQTIPAGSSTYTFTVVVNGDVLNEPAETFFVNVAGVTGATVADGQGLGTITNDDALPGLSINSVTVNEGNAGTTNATFTVTLSAASGQTVTVNYATANGTATAGTDYTVNTGTLTYTPGQVTKTVTVLVNGDTTPEANETFTVGLSGATNATITTATGTGTITNDDVPVTVNPATLPTPQIGVAYSNTVTASGGAAPYTYSLTAGALPPGISFNAAGVFSGTPTGGGTFNVTVTATDSSGAPGPYTGSRAYSFVVAPATITLPATALPVATRNAAYSANLNPASGGTAPYTYSLTAGPLPAGVSFNAAGQFSGTPTVIGTFNLTVMATDSSVGTGPYNASRTYALTISDVAPVSGAVSATVAFNSSANPIPTNLTGGAATSVAIASAASHGTATASGTTISYTPTAGYAGPDSFTYTATNSGGTSAPATVTITVGSPTITVTASAGLNTMVGSAYTQTFTWSGGTSPYSAFSVSNLPAGLSITGTTANSVTIAGTPTTAGSFSLNASAADSSTGLGPFTTAQVFTLTIAAPTLTLAPAGATFTTAYAAAYSQAFTASGGIGAYSYTLSGTLPTGVTFSGNTLSGTPTAPGSYPISVTATDTGSTGAGAPFTVTNNYTLVVTAPTVALTPATLPNTSAGAAYSQTVTATGAVAPYDFTTTAGALPTGLTLATTGDITGTPTAVGTFSFTVQATDANGQNGTRAYTVVVAAPLLTLAPAGATFTTAYAAAYSQAFTAAGGVGPYSYSLSGALPAGVTFSGDTLSGTPTVPGNFPISVTATDTGSTGLGAPFIVTNNYTLVVTAPTIALTPATLPGASAGSAYSQTVTASGAVAPYTFTITAGALPTGLSLATSGAISGTPTAAGSSTFTVQAADANGQTGTQAYTVVITVPTLTLTPATVPGGTANTAYSQTFTASGGIAPYSFAVSTGALPAGLSLSTTGALTGTPTASGTFNFSVTVTDSTGGTAATATTAYSLVIAAPTLTLSPATLVTGQQQQAYSQTFSAAGGIAPYTYTVASGALPPGLALNGTSGVLSGTPTADGTYTFGITATDSTSGTPATVTRSFTILIALRPDPSKDAEVLGLLDAQVASTRRFAEAQIGNFRQHLERLHDGSGAGSRGGGNNLSFNATNSFDPYRDCLQATVVDNTLDCSQSRGNTLAANASDNGTGNAASGGGNNNSPVNLWVGGVIRNGDRDATNGRSGFDFESDGVSIGADYRVNSSFVIGGGLGIGHDTTDVGNNGSQVKGDAKTAVIYGSYHPGESFYIDGLVGRQNLSYDLRRYVTATGGQVFGERDGDQWLASVAIGADIHRDALVLSPYLRWDYASADLDGYTERGDAIWALRYADQKIGSSTVNLGLRVQNRYETSWGAFSPQFRFEYQHDLRNNEDALISYADVLSGPVYRAVILGAQKNRVEFGLGGAFELQRQWALRLEYRFQKSDIDDSSAIQVNVEKTF